MKVAAAFEDDPNSPEQGEGTSGRPAETQPRRRFGKGITKPGNLAEGRNGEDKRSKQKNKKLSPEQLKAMGYDDVDEFADEERPFERLQLKEDDPL
jgi:hypothetical protein